MFSFQDEPGACSKKAGGDDGGERRFHTLAVMGSACTVPVSAVADKRGASVFFKHVRVLPARLGKFLPGLNVHKQLSQVNLAMKSLC